jgi:hypothetical protein
VQEQIQAQNARDNVFSNVEYDTKGNAYVRDKDGNRTPWQASPLATDFTMFDPKVTTRDVGGLREEAQSTDTKQYIGWSHNGYWNKDEAADIYNNSMNLVETDNQSDAIEFRLKVINDGDALNQNLLTTEEDRVRFMNGDYDSTNPADKKFVRMEDWGRNRFIDLSRFSKTMTAQEEKNRKERGLKVDAVDRLFSGGKSFLLNEYMEGLERSGYDVADTNLVQATYPISDVKAVQVGGEVVVPSVMTIKPNGDIVVKGSVASRAAGSGELEYTDYEREFENGTQEYIDASVSLDQALQSTFGEGYTVDFLSSQEALDRLKEFDLDKATDSVVAGSESTTEQSTQQGPIDASVYNNK